MKILNILLVCYLTSSSRASFIDLSESLVFSVFDTLILTSSKSLPSLLLLNDDLSAIAKRSNYSLWSVIGSNQLYIDSPKQKFCQELSKNAVDVRVAFLSLKTADFCRFTSLNLVNLASVNIKTRKLKLSAALEYHSKIRTQIPSVEAIDIYQDRSILFQVADLGTIDQFKTVLEYFPWFYQENNQTIFEFASSKGKLDILKLLVSTSNSINSRMLTNTAANPSITLETALQRSLIAACRKGKGKIVDYLVSIGVSVDSRDHENKTCLMNAIEMNQYTTALNLIDLGANSSLQSDDGRNALMYLMQKEPNAVAERLFEAILTETNSRDNLGDTYLIKAAKNRKQHWITLLLEHPINADSTDQQGKSALMIAISNRLFNVITELIVACKKINQRDSDGMSALMYASELGNVDIVAMLLEFGADPNLRNCNRKTAIELTTSSKVKNILEKAIEFHESLVKEHIPSEKQYKCRYFDFVTKSQ